MDQISSDKIIPRTINLSSFEKGAISEAIMYSDIKFKKSGKEIKEHLNKVKVTTEATKIAIQAQMAVICANLPIQPNEEASKYLYNGHQEKIGTVLMYSYETRYPKSDTVSDSLITSVVNESEKPVDNSRGYSDYNSLAYKFIDICTDLCIIESCLNNFDDKTQYELTTRQLTALGF